MDNVDLKMMFGSKPRLYLRDGQWYPSVTSILGIFDKRALRQWAADMVIEYIRQNCEKKGHYYLVDEVALREASTYYLAVAKEAGEKGTDIHGLIDVWAQIYHQDDKTPLDIALFQSDEVTKFMFHSFVVWAEKFNLRPLASEVKVFGARYAGRYDLRARVDGSLFGEEGDRIALLDIKRSKSYYPEHGLQLAAYRHAETEPIQRMGVIRLDDSNCKAHMAGDGGRKKVVHFKDYSKDWLEYWFKFESLVNAYWECNDIEKQLQELNMRMKTGVKLPRETQDMLLDEEKKQQESSPPPRWGGLDIIPAPDFKGGEK